MGNWGNTSDQFCWRDKFSNGISDTTRLRSTQRPSNNRPVQLDELVQERWESGYAPVVRRSSEPVTAAPKARVEATINSELIVRASALCIVVICASLCARCTIPRSIQRITAVPIFANYIKRYISLIVLVAIVLLLYDFYFRTNQKSNENRSTRTSLAALAASLTDQPVLVRLKSSQAAEQRSYPFLLA